jgi:hypothetical protein
VGGSSTASSGQEGDDNLKINDVTFRLG